MSATASAGAHREPNYMGVWWALLVLTIVEVFVGYARFLPRGAMVASLVALALAKAVLVAAYFMHLKFERRTLALIVAIPLLLSAILLVGTAPDGAAQGRIPSPPPAAEAASGG